MFLEKFHQKNQDPYHHRGSENSFADHIFIKFQKEEKQTQIANQSDAQNWRKYFSIYKNIEVIADRKPRITW